MVDFGCKLSKMATGGLKVESGVAFQGLDLEGVLEVALLVHHVTCSTKWLQ